jgi:hypothetical protein
VWHDGAARFPLAVPQIRMSWRERLLTWLIPGTLSGITSGTWLRVLRENHFAIDRPYWWRAAAVALGSIPNTALASVENLMYGGNIRIARVDPPLFVLGIWRSGTTHLHNLLAQDCRLACPNFYQVVFPHTFLCTERIAAKPLGWFLPRKRPQDNMSMGAVEPQEDEWAFCSLTGRTFLMSLIFPGRAAHYDRFLTLRETTEEERAEWKAALLWFIRKLSIKHGRPLVLKSPGHTCRIRLLLELFPDARFVHLYRNPYDVFQSSLHTVRTLAPWAALQRPNHEDLENRTIRQYKEVYEVFFAERGQIPPGHLHELAFEELEKDPVGQLRVLYERLGLPDMKSFEPALREYLRSVSGYRKNAFPELPLDMKERLALEWRQCFHEWGYPVPGCSHAAPSISGRKN